MDGGDLATWIGAGVALLVGVLGLIVGLIGNSRAKKASQEAVRANGIAADALEQARIANGAAEQANQLSEDANTIAKGVAAQQREDWLVRWDIQWDANVDAIVVRNVGKDPAREATFVIRYKELHEIHREQLEVAPGAEVRLAVERVAEDRSAHAIRGGGNIVGSARPGGSRIVSWGLFQADLELTTTWKTGLGVPQVSIEKLGVS